MPALEDRFWRTDYDLTGEVIYGGPGKVTRRAIMQGETMNSSIIGDPATDDIFAWIVWETNRWDRAVPYIAVFKKRKEVVR